MTVCTTFPSIARSQCLLFCELPLETRQDGPPSPLVLTPHTSMMSMLCCTRTCISLAGICSDLLENHDDLFSVLSRHYYMVRMFCYLIFDLL
jgi:hypothetical protein